MKIYFRATLTLLLGGLLGAQESTFSGRNPPPPDALHALSSALEALSTRVSHAVVQVFSTGYLMEENGEQTRSGLVSKQRGSGSGVILTDDGYIVTNGHVVQGSQRVQVQLAYSLNDRARPHASIVRERGKVFTAKVVGIDRESDIAVLKIEQTGLPHLDLGDSDKIHQGQLVLAFGNPLGLENSVTLGVVSSTARQLHAEDRMVYIQTDAAINPGNSGGPLLDSDGRVVGINKFILSQSGGNEGVGFSIPSNIVRNVFDQIRKSGRVHRGEIGVVAQTITPELAAGLKLPQDYGVILADVSPGKPAEKAGVEIGDIVLSLDGKAMENARQLEVNLYRKPISGIATLGILRGTEQITVRVPVIEREGDPERFADLVSSEDSRISRLGILCLAINQEILNMLPELRKSYGVLVAARAPGARYSAIGGLEQGDVIYSLNNVPTSSVDILRTAVDRLKPGDPAVLQVERDGKLMFITLTE
ncbi:MAG: trypsin-like peptidase domain-containing protein [Acidobacteriota bacterium]|nr:trypsin-like peptidase domain-containing protein [Acidobacteriota bacterium]